MCSFFGWNSKTHTLSVCGCPARSLGLDKFADLGRHGGPGGLRKQSRSGRRSGHVERSQYNMGNSLAILPAVSVLKYLSYQVHSGRTFFIKVLSCKSTSGLVAARDATTGHRGLCCSDMYALSLHMVTVALHGMWEPILSYKKCSIVTMEF